MRSSLRVALAVLLLASGTASAQHRKKHDGGMAPLGDKPAAKGGALVSLIVACSTPGANIYVDGELIGQSPMDLPLPVTAGDHSIKVMRPGFAPFIDVFSTAGKQEVKLEVELVPVAGVLRVQSNVAGARVLVDGKYVGDAPIEVETEAGPRAVQVSKGGYKDFFQNVMAVAGQETPLDVKLDELPAGLNPYKPLPAAPPRWYQKGWVWGVVAAGAVGVAGGTVGIVYASRPYDLQGKSDFYFESAAGLK